MDSSDAGRRRVAGTLACIGLLGGLGACDTTITGRILRDAAGESTTDARPSSGPDAAPDVIRDSGSDARVDAVVPTDAALDAGREAAAEPGPEAGREGGVDAMLDAVAEAGRDAGLSDVVLLEGGVALTPGPSTTFAGDPTGGGEVDDPCGAGEAVIGVTFDSASAYYAGGITHYTTQCGRLGRVASGTVVVTPTSTVPSGTSRGSWMYMDATFTLACPTNEVVMGFTGHSGTLRGPNTASIGLQCARITVSGNSFTRVAGTSVAEQGNTTASTATSADCPAGQIAIGAHLRVGEILDAFGLMCGGLP